MPKLYKILAVGGYPCNGGSGKYHLPTKTKVGKWMAKEPVSPCFSGYHVCTWKHLKLWIDNAYSFLSHGFFERYEIYEVEVRGAAVYQFNKSVHAQIRLLKKVAEGGKAELKLWWNKNNDQRKRLPMKHLR